MEDVSGKVYGFVKKESQDIASYLQRKREAKRASQLATNPPAESLQSGLQVLPSNEADDEMAKRLDDMRQEIERLRNDDVLSGLNPEKRAKAMLCIKNVLGENGTPFTKSIRTERKPIGEGDTSLGAFGEYIMKVREGKINL